jgi:hypothetical protein
VRLSVPVLREVISRLLRRPQMTLEEIAREISRVMRRTEEARIYAWVAEHGRYPPPRGDTG